MTACTISGCQRIETHRVQAEVLATTGQCFLAGSNRPLVEGDAIGRGHGLQTAASSAASVMLLPDAFAELKANTAIEIKDLSMQIDGNETADGIEAHHVAVALKTGTATFWLHRKGVSHSEFLIETPHALIRATDDTLLRVEVGADSSRVICVQGAAEVKSNRDFEPIRSDDFATFGAQAARHHVDRTKFESYPEIQHELDDTLEAMRFLRRLFEARQHAVPAWQ